MRRLSVPETRDLRSPHPCATLPSPLSTPIQHRMSSAEDMSKPDSAVLEGGEEQKASRQPSRGDIAQAVASRLQSQGDSVEGEEAKQENAQKAKVRKTVNEVTATSNYERACACLGVSSRCMRGQG